MQRKKIEKQKKNILKSIQNYKKLSINQNWSVNKLPHLNFRERADENEKIIIIVDQTLSLKSLVGRLKKNRGFKREVKNIRNVVVMAAAANNHFQISITHRGKGIRNAVLLDREK